MLARAKRLVVLDFDGLLVSGNLSSAVTQHLAPGYGHSVRKAVQIGAMSRESAYAALRRIFVGKSVCDIWAAIRCACREIPWRPGAVTLLQQLAQVSRCVILSGGLGDAIRAKLDEEGLGIRVIAPRLRFEGSVCSGWRLSLSDTQKGIVVRRLRRFYEDIWALGHAVGDLPMLMAATTPVIVQVSTPWSYPRNCHVVQSLEEAGRLLGVFVAAR